MEKFKTVVTRRKHVSERKSGRIRNGNGGESDVRTFHGIRNADIGRDGRRVGVGKIEVKRRRRRKVVSVRCVQILQDVEIKNRKNKSSDLSDGNEGSEIG